MSTNNVKGLRERLKDGETVLCAEGYIWELERRGFVSLGVFTPTVVLEHPERVYALSEEFAMAGSDVVLACTYYGHRAKMRVVGREDECRTLNMKALKIARDVADKHGKLMAGNLSNTTVFEPNDEEKAKEAFAMFKEQVEMAVEGGADFIIGETFNALQEAKLALQAIKTYGKGMPAVINIVPYTKDCTTDDVLIEDALATLEALGADVVGLNCGRGLATVMPLLKKARKLCKGPLASIPNPVRTTEQYKSMQSLRDAETGKPLYPLNITKATCYRDEIQQFTKEAQDLGIQFLGLCCCNSPYLFREMAMACDKEPPLAKYRPIHSRSYLAGPTVSPFVKKVRDFITGESNDIYPKSS